MEELLKKWDENELISSKTFKSIYNIKYCCLNIKKQAYNYVWRYENNPLPKNYIYPKNKVIIPRIVNQYDINNNFIKKWNSIREIKENLGYSASTIYECCNGKFKLGNGFIWKWNNKTII